MTAEAGLFDLPDDSPEPAGQTSRAERRRQLIAARIQAGWHPLGRNIRLHPDAAVGPDDDGLHCGTCRFREIHRYHDKSYPKCVYGDGVRVTHSETSDVRAWWPACTDHQPESEN